jgi:hypothetical protein
VGNPGVAGGHEKRGMKHRKAPIDPPEAENERDSGAVEPDPPSTQDQKIDQQRADRCRRLAGLVQRALGASARTVFRPHDAPAESRYLN